MSMFVQNYSALICMGCEVTNSSDTCEFSYECPKLFEYCETLVSKVEGEYSVILSCATKDKCGNEPNGKGLSQCQHRE